MLTPADRAVRAGRRPHTGSVDDAAGWQTLRDYLKPMNGDGAAVETGRLT
ncbi:MULTISPECIES: hypothetical protein [unclassified Micromonospora]